MAEGFFTPAAAAAAAAAAKRSLLRSVIFHKSHSAGIAVL
jgi:hypothetical protein